MLQLRGRRDAREHVNEVAVIGDRVLHVGVRPVGSPQHAVPVVRDQRREGIREGIPRIVGWIEAVR